MIRDLKKLDEARRLKEWKQAVLKRDHNCCVVCAHILLTNLAHHIYRKSKYPDLKFDVNNGVTLCKHHHYVYHFALSKEEKEVLKEYFALIALANWLVNNYPKQSSVGFLLRYLTKIVRKRFHIK